MLDRFLVNWDESQRAVFSSFLKKIKPKFIENSRFFA